MIAAHPVLGVGIGNFYAAYPRFMLPEAWREPLLYHAHNVALDFWSMLGIVGLAAFVWLEVAFWRTALQLRRAALSPDMRALLIGLAASMAYALAHGLVDTLYFLPDLALAFMLTMGMVVALEETGSR
jgi:O-antigen ligase